MSNKRKSLFERINKLKERVLKEDKEVDYKDFPAKAKKGIKQYSSMSTSQMEPVRKAYKKKTGKSATNIDNKVDFFSFVADYKESLSRLDSLYEKVCKESVKVGDKYKDSEGNSFIVKKVTQRSGQSNDIILKGARGEIDIGESELKFYNKESINEVKLRRESCNTEALDNVKLYQEMRKVNEQLWKVWNAPKKSLIQLKKYTVYLNNEFKKKDKMFMLNAKPMYDNFNNQIVSLEDAVIIINKIKNGMTYEQIKPIIQKSKYWECNDSDYYDDLLKSRGSMDLYVQFKNGKMTKYYF